MHDTKRKQYEQLARKYHIKLVFIIAERKEHGHPVNGYLKERIIYLNETLEEHTDQILGHELTYLIRDEGQEYREIQRILFEVARRRNEYDSRLESITELYKGIDTDLQEELTADLAGDYIFNEEFVNELVQDKTAFQKVYDHIKEWLKVVTSGSQEYKQIYEAKKLFEKALKNRELQAQQEMKKSISVNANKDAFNYNNMITKKDVIVTDVSNNTIPKDNNGKIDRFAVVENARKSIIDAGGKETNGIYTIRINDTGVDVAVSRNALRHGLNRESNSTSVTVIAEQSIGNILKNAVKFNELSPRDSLIKETDIYISVGNDADNYYVTRIIVDKLSNNVIGVNTEYITKSIKAKKRAMGADNMPARNQSNAPIHASITNLSVRDLIELVKDTYPDVLSKDILNHYGMQREKTEISSDVKYSLGGTNSKTANMISLQEAKDLQEQDVAMETIYKTTGWYVGSDGKWRYEIDDSAMVYHKAGDVTYAKDHPGYARQQELTKKFFDMTITDAETKELSRLDSIYGQDYGRLSNRVAKGNAKLSDIIQHDALFEAYPQLRDVSVRFEDLNGGTGAFSPSENIIRIDNRLREAPNKTLLHEIQHAIQEVEGFTKGSSWHYWENISAEKVGSAERAERKAWEAISDKDTARAINRAGNDVELAESLKRNLTVDDAKLFDAYEKAHSEYLEADSTNDFYSWAEEYINTAGEIEARDVSNRYTMSSEERANTMPDIGDENTVHAKYSLSPQEVKARDDSYMMAVNSGDTETAQKMVDEAAKASMPNTKIVDEAGNPLRVYHGASNQFTVFDKSKGRPDMDIQGMFFSPEIEDASGYGNNVGTYFLNIENPASFMDGLKALRKYQQEDNAGIKAREYLESMGYDGVNNENEEYISFNSNQIKSANPITYDESGNVIPLSQRFNNNNDDIRYSLSKSPDKDITKDDISYEEGNGINEVADSYTESEIEKYSKKNAIYINGVNMSVSDFINQFSGKGVEKKLYLGKVNDTFAKRVFDDTGVSIIGRNLALSSSDLGHISIRHGENGLKTDPKHIEVSDIENIAKILSKYSSVEYMEEENAKGQLVKKLNFYTDTENDYGYKTVEIISSGYNELVLKTVFAQKKEKNRPMANVADATNTSTSNNDRNPVFSINSINNGEENINSYEQESSDNPEPIKQLSPI